MHHINLLARVRKNKRLKSVNKNGRDELGKVILESNCEINMDKMEFEYDLYSNSPADNSVRQMVRSI